MPERNSLLARGALVLGLLLAWCNIAAAQRDRSMLHVSHYPLIGDDYQRVANHTVTAAQSSSIERLPGIVVVGNPQGKVTLVEFYDLNCPYCRIASVDINDMIETDSELRLVLVPFPVLGVASIQSGRVELAVAKLGTARQFYEFHRKIYSRRGVVDAARALEVARELGFDESRLVALADSDEITETMKEHVRLGDALGLAATPAFVINDVAVLGHPGRHSLQVIVDSVGNCGKVMC